VRARAAWAIVALTAVAVVLDTVFTAAHRPLMSEATWADHGWPLAPLASAGCALMGALIVSRYPRQLLGWLLCAASLLSVTLAAEAYSIWVLDGDGPGPERWAHVAAWAGPLLGWPAFTALVMIFLFAPDGRLLSPRWRWAVWVSLTGLALRTLGTFLIDPGDFVHGGEYDVSGFVTLVLTVGYLCVAAGLIASAVSLVLRLLRARDDVRRQLLWIASSAAFLAFGVVFILVVPRIQGEEGTWLAGLPLRLAQVAVPLCVAVAVLRHRLLTIDLIVNRALIFALATGLVAIGYMAVVVVVGVAVGERTPGFWPSLVASALVAMAFQPLRRRVVKLADRLAFGPSAAPYEALADLSRRLGESVDPETLLPAVAEAVAKSVSASRVTVLLHVPPATDRSGVWPPLAAEDPTTSGLELPVIDQGERLGSLTVEMPTGRPMRARDQRLLTHLAEQAGVAFRSARLTAELSAQVDRLGDQTRELAESRRRLIDAGDAERRRLEHAIARRVAPHLEPLPDRLGALSALGGRSVAGLDAPMVGLMVDELNIALEALREITRGVFPAQLVRSGLSTAVGSLLAQADTDGRLVVESQTRGRRFDSNVESAAYFCVSEATRDLDGPILVRMAVREDHLHVVVSGSGQRGLILADMRDRVEAAGGSVSITEAEQHTVVGVRLPAHAPVG
jgi:signal transduction histidine kinase